MNLARKNTAALGADLRAGFLLKDARKIPARGEGQSAAGLIFLDPPYGKNLIPPVLAALERGSWMQEKALIVMELGKKENLSLPEKYTCVWEKTYGDTKIVLAQYTGIK